MTHNSQRIGYIKQSTVCFMALSLSIFLSSCNAVHSDKLEATLKLIERGCKFRADAGPIMRIIAKGAPGLRDAAGIASAVCEEVERYRANRNGLAAPVVVSGVAVTGEPIP